VQDKYAQLVVETILIEGGPDSGHWGHSGDSPNVGGSSTSKVWRAKVHSITQPNKIISLSDAKEIDTWAPDRAKQAKSVLMHSSLKSPGIVLRDEDGTILGAAGFEIWDTKPRYRGQKSRRVMALNDIVSGGKEKGIGTRMMRHVAEEGIKAGVEGLAVQSASSVSYNFYFKLGMDDAGGAGNLWWTREKMTTFLNDTKKFAESFSSAIFDLDSPEGILVKQPKERTPEEWDEFLLMMEKLLVAEGGAGSGNIGHLGRPGEVGGSSPTMSSKTLDWLNGWVWTKGASMPSKEISDELAHFKPTNPVTLYRAELPKGAVGISPMPLKSYTYNRELAEMMVENSKELEGIQRVLTSRKVSPDEILFDSTKLPSKYKEEFPGDEVIVKESQPESLIETFRKVSEGKEQCPNM
jgi:hypothetical protein